MEPDTSLIHFCLQGSFCAVDRKSPRQPLPEPSGRWYGLRSYNKKFEPERPGGNGFPRKRKMYPVTRRIRSAVFCLRLAVTVRCSRGMRTLTKKGVKKIPKDLPVLFVSGSQDPVGDFGAGVWKVYEQFRDAG